MLIIAGRVPCPKCSKFYKNKNSLDVHLSRDCSRLKQYCCPLCSKGFKRKEHYRCHYVRMHGDF